MLFPQIDFDFRSQIIDIVRIGAQEHQDFIRRMDMRSDTALPDAGLAAESPGDIHVQAFQVFPVHPGQVIGISGPRFSGLMPCQFSGDDLED